MREISIGLVLATLCGGCGGASPHETTTPTAAAPSRWPAPVTARAEPWRATVFADVGDEPILVGTDADGSQLVIANEARARVGATDIEWAHDLAANTLMAATQIDGTWYFACSGGVILSAQGSFLGPLTAVVQTPASIEVAEAVPGAMLLLLSDASLYRYAAGNLAPLTVPGVGLAFDGSFASATSGAALVAPGRLHVTDDGVTYQAIDLGARIPLRVNRSTDGTFVVELVDGWARIRGHAVEPLEDDPGSATPAFPAELRDRLWLSESNREPFDQTLLPGPNGHIVRYTDDDGTLVVWDPDHGARHLVPPAEGCALLSFGDSAAALCGATPSTVFVSEDFESWTQIGEITLWSADENTFTAVDGSTILGLGACGTVPEGTDLNTSVCWHDGTAFRQRMVPPNTTVYDVRRDRALVGWYDDEVGSQVGLLDLTSADPPTALSVPEGTEGIQSPHFTADGLVTGLTATEAGTALLVGPIDSPLALRMIPEGAQQVALGDALHGLAIGETFAQIWVTEDGAASWQPLEARFSGNPGDYSVVDDLVRCSMSGCRVRDTLFWGPASVLARTADDLEENLFWHPTATGTSSSDDGAERTARAWDCEMPTRVPPSMQSYLTSSGWANARSRWATDDEGNEGVHLSVRWGGADARGAFIVESGDGAIDSNGDTGQLLGATRSLALLYFPNSDGAATLIAVRPGQPPLATTPIRLGDDWYLSPHEALPLDNGGFLVRLDATSRTAIDVLVQIGPDGHEVARRTFVWPARITDRMAAIRGTEIGIVARVGADLVFYGAGAAARLGEAPASVAVCGSARPSVRMMRDHDPYATVALGEYDTESFRDVLGWTGTGLCVESITFGFGFSVPDVSPGLVRGVATGAAMRFTAFSPETGAVPLTCTAPSN